MRMTMVVLAGGTAVALSMLIPGLERWVPYVALCAGGAVHIVWIIQREEAANR